MKERCSRDEGDEGESKKEVAANLEWFAAKTRLSSIRYRAGKGGGRLEI